MAKLKREHVIFCASWDDSEWEALGKDNDDLSMEMNPDTETGKNVLGESTFTHSGYEPEVDLDTYYADPDRALFEKLFAAAVERKYAEEDLLGYFGVAYFDEVNKDKETMTGDFYQQRAWFVPQSLGGDTSGLGIPFNVNPIGSPVKKKITYTRADNGITVEDADP